MKSLKKAEPSRPDALIREPWPACILRIPGPSLRHLRLTYLSSGKDRKGSLHIPVIKAWLAVHARIVISRGTQCDRLTVNPTDPPLAWFLRGLTSVLPLGIDEKFCSWFAALCTDTATASHPRPSQFRLPTCLVTLDLEHTSNKSLAKSRAIAGLWYFRFERWHVKHTWS
ncbi:hypothetical protein CBOM_07852 [Ceraceosorus bombacis]|uniref:Uncharacterized protein n=1 Tax=Ceraceosorus bombacis TaxID=401625 RepID=A0A0P1BP15_9BASI|nr:hypothetical protein CBOM_07852 [Ceraceosorus bombacis]